MDGNAANPIPMSMWMHKSTIRFWERNPEALRMPMRIMLSNDMTVRSMSTTFEPICRDTHFINIVARRILANRLSGKIYQEEEIFKAEQSIFLMYERVNKYFEIRSSQAELKLRLSGFEPEDLLSRSRGRTYELESATQMSTTYVRLLKNADNYLVHNYNLWAAGELGNSPAECLAAKLFNEKEARGQLFALSRATTRAYNDIRGLVNRILAERKEVVENRNLRRARRTEHENNLLAKQKKQMAKASGSMQADMNSLALTTA